MVLPMVVEAKDMTRRKIINSTRSANLSLGVGIDLGFELPTYPLRQHVWTVVICRVS